MSEVILRLETSKNARRWHYLLILTMIFTNIFIVFYITNGNIIHGFSQLDKENKILILIMTIIFLSVEIGFYNLFISESDNTLLFTDKEIHVSTRSEYSVYSYDEVETIKFVRLGSGLYFNIKANIGLNQMEVEVQVKMVHNDVFHQIKELTLDGVDIETEIRLI